MSFRRENYKIRETKRCHSGMDSREVHSGSELVEKHKTTTSISLPSFMENGAAAPARFQMHDSSDCWNREAEKKRESPEWESIND